MTPICRQLRTFAKKNKYCKRPDTCLLSADTSIARMWSAKTDHLKYQTNHKKGVFMKNIKYFVIFLFFVSAGTAYSGEIDCNHCMQYQEIIFQYYDGYQDCEGACFLEPEKYRSNCHYYCNQYSTGLCQRQDCMKKICEANKMCPDPK